MRNLNSFKLFVSSLIVFSALVANAAFYEDRPSILKVPPKADSNVDGWKTASNGHFLFLAQTLTFFPTSEYYFLARDIEYLYDLAQLMAKDDPVLKQRIHLVPVSTALSQQTEGMVKYLEQEGLTKKNLEGRSALFVDSCCSGSVPDRIDEAFKKRGVKVQGLLIQTDEYPSSRMADFAGADGAAIEDLPHFTRSATAYVKSGGKIKIQAGVGPTAEQSQSLAIMGQIRHDFDNAQKRKEFKELVGLMRTVYSYLVKETPYKKATREQALKALQVMAVKFEVPVDKFLADVKGMARKSYAQPEIARVADLSSASHKFSAAVDLAVINKIILEPNSFESYLDKVSLSPTEITSKALETLTASSAKELGVTEQKYKQLLESWIEHFDNHSYYAKIKSDVLLKAYAIASPPRDAMDRIFELVESSNTSYGKFDAKKFSTAAIDVLSRDGYAYKKGSGLYTLVHEFDDRWERSPESFKRVMLNVIENADDALLEKLSVDLFVRLPQVDRWSNKSDLEKNVVEVMKALVDALPTISKPMIVAYLKSQMALEEIRPYREFAKWLFEQREYFDAEALKTPVSSDARQVLPGQSKVPKTNVRVEHFVDVHAGPIPLPVTPLKGLKGQLCSRIYSGK